MRGEVVRLLRAGSVVGWKALVFFNGVLFVCLVYCLTIIESLSGVFFFVWVNDHVTVPPHRLLPSSSSILLSTEQQFSVPATTTLPKQLFGGLQQYPSRLR